MNEVKTASKQYGVFLVFAAAMLWASDAPIRVFLSETLNSSVIVLLEHGIALVVLTFSWGNLLFTYEIYRLSNGFHCS